MTEIFIASLSLSVIHAMIPNHWIPLVTISKAESWSMKESLVVTALTGIAHSTGTITIGIALGYVGMQLSHQFEQFSEIIAPLILIVLGVVYLSLGARHNHKHINTEVDKRKSKAAIIFALTLSMFLSPCLEMESYFLVAAKEGWAGIALVSAVFLFATTAVMLLLVFLGFQSLQHLHWDWLEKYEKKITGVVLLLIGALTLLLQDNHLHFH